MKRLLRILVVLMIGSLTAWGQIPSGYYNTATGVGFTLKTQLYNKIKNHTNNSYGTLWTIYATSDRDNQYENDNTLFDLYSENPTGTDPVTFLYSTDQCGTYTLQGQCYNREHIIPQSVFGSATPMQNDAHFVVPTDGFVNGMRSNNPHGNVAVANWTSLNGSKRGSSAVPSYSGTVFEPLNDFKGDIARMYFYFATRYQNTVASYSYQMFNGTSDTVFKSNFLTMLMNWHNSDPVSAREIARNDAIYAYQNNRNPFIDHPEYVDLIWGVPTSLIAQTISFNALSNVVVGSPSFNLNASATSNLLVSFNSSNPNVVSIVGNVATVVGVGTCDITASQAGNSTYAAAPDVVQSITVLPLTTSIALVAWDFHSLPGGTGANNFGPSPYAASYADANVISSGLMRGAGVGASSTQVAAARAWGGTINTSTSTSAIASNVFYSFTLSAQSGYLMNIDSLSPIDYRRSSSGATNALVQYSVDGGSFVTIATLNFTSTSSSGASAGSVNVSAVSALHNLNANQVVNFRLVPYGGTGGTCYLFDRANNSNYDFAVLGSLIPCTPSVTVQNESIISNDIPYNWNGQVLNSSGTYSASFMNQNNCDSVVTLHLTVLPANALLNMKMWLEGFYEIGGTLKPVLFENGISMNLNDCDTIVFRLHEDVTPYAVLHSGTAILKSDGSLQTNIPGMFIGDSYYISIVHRNSIETWSSNSVLISSITNYDFTTHASKAYGGNQKEVETGVFAIFSGDINQDGSAESNDFSLWEQDANNFASGYLNTDLNGDGATESNDYALWESNANEFVGVVKP